MLLARELPNPLQGICPLAINNYVVTRTPTTHMNKLRHLQMRQRQLRFRRLANVKILNIAASEDDVLENVVSRRNGAIGGALFGPEGSDLGESHRTLVRIDGIQNTLVTNIRLQDGRELRRKLSESKRATPTQTSNHFISILYLSNQNPHKILQTNPVYPNH